MQGSDKIPERLQSADATDMTSLINVCLFCLTRHLADGVPHSARTMAFILNVGSMHGLCIMIGMERFSGQRSSSQYCVSCNSPRALHTLPYAFEDKVDEH